MCTRQNLIRLLFLLIPLTMITGCWVDRDSGTYDTLYAVYCVNGTTAYVAAGCSKILKTTDGGNNWFKTNALPSFYNSVHFSDANVGWGLGIDVGYPNLIRFISKTNDGGQNWKVVESESITNQSNYFRSIFFINNNVGWVLESYGAILKTRDGGENWNYEFGGIDKVMNSVHFTDSNNGWMVGEKGTILKSIDGGKTWYRISSGTSADLYSICFTNQNNGWIVGAAGTIMHTTDGGKNWLFQKSGTNLCLKSVYFNSNYKGFAVGGGNINRGIILETSDGGNSWSLKSFPVALNSVHFYNQNFGFAVGENGTILQYFKNNVVLPKHDNFADEIDSTFLKQYENNFLINNKNVAFMTLFSENRKDILNVLSENAELMAEAKDILTEIKQPIQDMMDGKEGVIYNPVRIYAFLDHLSAKSPATLKILIQDFKDEMVQKQIRGKSFLGLRLADQSKQELPTYPQLFQNSPNPFNPETTISYELQSEGFVQINIYNIRGELVRELVNEQAAPGRYSITWNGKGNNFQDLPSGMYFIKMRVGDHVATQKAMLLK